MLLAFNKESIDLHDEKLAERGIIIFEQEKAKEVADTRNLFGIPLEKLATESAGDKLMVNTVALGAALGHSPAANSNARARQCAPYGPLDRRCH